MKQANKAVIGQWRITDMEMWDAEYFDMEVPTYVTVRENLTGSFQFGLVQGELDGRIGVIGGYPRLEFSWSGSDENDEASGRGWLQVTGNAAEGGIFIHQGDDSRFSATRQDDSA
ncbi:hypothetical protein [Methylotetracoccus oryzae]|uniref:hypothetical protein n=1 Tax=Methylotetracoccus oryzae TaxID=1919059 RepID=UPI0011184D97|nr:hypothetical protein [Methylotetracoccus oryzae]